jgi:hypothetical protein
MRHSVAVLHLSRSLHSTVHSATPIETVLIGFRLC